MSQAPSLADEVSPREGRRRALIVEDEGINVALVKKALEQGGYDVVGMAPDGLQAVELGRAIQPDFILMDINLPGIDGIEATKQIMAERPVPIIMLTAYSDPDRVEQAIEAGACAYWVKPITSAQLLTDLPKAFEEYDRFT